MGGFALQCDFVEVQELEEDIVLHEASLFRVHLLQKIFKLFLDIICLEFEVDLGDLGFSDRHLAANHRWGFRHFELLVWGLLGNK